MSLTKNTLSLKIVALCVATGLMFSAAQAQTTVNAAFVGGSTIRNDGARESGQTNGANSATNASGSPLLIIGHVAGATPNRMLRGAMQFNIENLGVPQGATIQSVKLVMRINENDNQITVPANLNVGLYSITQDFNPLLVSWNNAANAGGGNPVTPWTTLGGGGTFAPTPLDSKTIASTNAIGTYEFESAAFTALVQQSLSSGDTFVNLLLKLNSETDTNRELLRFALSGANAPQLVITYAPIPEPSHVGLALGAVTIGLICIRRRLKSSKA